MSDNKSPEQHENALAVMFKAPLPGKVKTRLTPALAPVDAALLYRAFLEDTFNKVIGLSGVALYGAYAPESAYGLGDITPEGMEVFPQAGADLGERMLNVFRRLFSSGHKNVIIIGSDSPDLPQSLIEEAFSSLTGGTPVVLGPALDGGYYLIGMSSLKESPFAGVPWSTPVVLERTVEALRKEGVSPGLLAPWHDIDTFEDLGSLVPGNAPATYKIIKRWGDSI